MAIRIGIIRSSSIGDVVLATACLEYLERAAPDAKIVWVGRKPTLALLNVAWPNVEVRELRSGASRSDRRDVLIALSACDLIVDLQTSFLSQLMTRRLARRGKKVFAARKSKLDRLRLVWRAFFRGRLWQLPSLVRTVTRYQYQMMLDTIEQGLKSCGGVPSVSPASSTVRPKLPLPAAALQDDSWWRDLNFGSWVAVACGASHKPKQAPMPVFKDILARLSELLASGNSARVGLVFVGSADDRHAANDLIDALGWHGPVLNLTGKITLEQSASLLTKVRALLSNDSGLAHIAEAVGVPVAVLFGPTVEAFGFAPWRQESRAYSAQVGCRPCSRHGKRACRFGDAMCFHGIDSRAVARHLANIVGGK